MIVHILCSMGKPLRVYAGEKDAYDEYRRLRDMDDYVDYAVISMEVEKRERTLAIRAELSPFTE
jgi:hypothetical protein